MINRTIFSNRLSDLRIIYNLSTLDLAQIVGLKSKGSIGDFEKGRTLPSAEVISKMADYFCCSIDYLFGRSDNPNTQEFLPAAEQTFFNDPDTWPELIDLYQTDKTRDPSHAPVFLRACELIRNEKKEKK